MTIVYVILGGAVGGAIGWLFDRLTRCSTEEVAKENAPRT
jgi:hypothetical protein